MPVEGDIEFLGMNSYILTKRNEAIHQFVAGPAQIFWSSVNLLGGGNYLLSKFGFCTASFAGYSLVKLLDVLLPLLPDPEEEIEAVEKIEESEEPAESIEVIEESYPDPDPTPYHRNAPLLIGFGKIDFLGTGERSAQIWAKLSPPLRPLK